MRPQLWANDGKFRFLNLVDSQGLECHLGNVTRMYKGELAASSRRINRVISHDTTVVCKILCIGKGQLKFTLNQDPVKPWNHVARTIA